MAAKTHLMSAVFDPACSLLAFNKSRNLISPLSDVTTTSAFRPFGSSAMPVIACRPPNGCNTSSGLRPLLKSNIRRVPSEQHDSIMFGSTALRASRSTQSVEPAAALETLLPPLLVLLLLPPQLPTVAVPSWIMLLHISWARSQQQTTSGWQPPAGEVHSVLGFAWVKSQREHQGNHKVSIPRDNAVYRAEHVRIR